MPSFLNSGLVDPSVPTASVRSIGIAMGLSFPLSIKDMLHHRDMSKVIRYGIYICTYTGATRGTILDDGWLDRAFSDRFGIASYFRKMSGGRQIVEWQVFPYKGDIMTLIEKQALENRVKTSGKVGDEIQPTWQAALNKGIPVDSVDRVIFVIDVAEARAGTTDPVSKHTFLAANDIRPNSICHEMGHAFGLRHSSQAEYNDYGDSYCLMGGEGPNPHLEFENPRLVVRTGFNSHGGTGPGICTPYLSKLGWIDSSINANHIYLTEDGTVSGDVTGTIYANQGGLPIGSTKRIALIINVSTPSSSSAYVSSQYWVEYRIQQGFDQRFWPQAKKKDDPQGALLLREVVSSYSYYLYLAIMLKDRKLRLPKLSYVIKITSFNSPTQEVSYSFEKA